MKGDNEINLDAMVGYVVRQADAGEVPQGEPLVVVGWGVDVDDDAFVLAIPKKGGTVQRFYPEDCDAAILPSLLYFTGERA